MDGKPVAVKARSYTHPYVIAGLVPLVFFLVFYFYPLAGIFLRSFVPDFPSHLHIELSFLNQIIGSQRLRHIIWFTFWQAAISTGLTLVFAFPCAFVMSHYQFKGKKFLTLCASIPFVLPAVVVAAALDANFGKNGWLGILNIRHPLVLIFMAHVFYNFSVMLRILTSFWTGLRGNIQETAAMLGAGPYQIFIHVTLPLLMPAVWAASFLVFIFCFSSFGIILILGGPAYSTIEAEIFRQAAHMFSFIFAGTALFIALVTGLCAALCLNHLDRIKAKNLAGFFDPLFMLPLSTSAVTLGFGIIITLDRPPLNLRSSILLVPLVHALVGFPFVLRAVLPALKSIPNNIREAASTLGAGPGNIFRCIDLPLICGALTAGAVFAFTISMGEFGATIFAAGPRTPTIPLAIYRFLGQPGAINYGQAMAISTLLMAITAAGFILIEKISSKGLQHF